jgi:hypothetical protein
MKTFLESAFPALIGAGIVLVTMHIFRAIWGHPKAAISVRRTDVNPLQSSKMYYRSWRSWISTGLMIFGFVFGAGLAATFWDPLERMGFGWCPPLLAGVTVAISLWFAMRFDSQEIRKFVGQYTPSDK